MSQYKFIKCVVEYISRLNSTKHYPPYPDENIINDFEILDAEVVNEQDIDFRPLQYKQPGIYVEYTSNYYIQIFYIKFDIINNGDDKIMDYIINEVKSILREKKILNILEEY